MKPDIQDVFQRMMSAYRRADYASAMPLCDILLESEPSRIDILITQAICHRSTQRFESAINFCRKAITADPTNPDAHNILAAIYRDMGRPEQAISVYQDAIEVTPGALTLQANLAETLRYIGRLNEACEVCNKALAIAPNDTNTLLILANVYQQLEDFDQAAAAYRRYLAIDTQQADVWFRLGIVLSKSNHPEEAIQAFQTALSISPDWRDAHIILGHLLAQVDRPHEAIAHYQAALRLEAKTSGKDADISPPAIFDTITTAVFNVDAEVQSALADYEKNNNDAVIEKCQRILQHHPERADVWTMLGISKKRTGDKEGAVACYKRAIQQMPGYTDAYDNLGRLLLDMGDLVQAEQTYRQALQVNAKLDNIAHSLGHLLLRRGKKLEAEDVFKQLVSDRPCGEYYNSLASVCDALGRPREALDFLLKALEYSPDSNLLFSNILFMMHYLPDITPEELSDKHKEFGRRFSIPAEQIPPHRNTVDPDRKLRIGYLGAGFRQDVVSTYLLPVLEHHDADGYEIFAYAEVKQFDAMTAIFKDVTHHWRDTVGLSDEEVAERIRQDQIDILVDLCGHTASNRLMVLSRKPAPVQIGAWIGYFDSTGLPSVDYVLMDEFHFSEQTQSLYQEEIWPLPRTGFCYRPNLATPYKPQTPALTKGYITFGSFNKPSKISESMIGVWSDILHAIPDSVLLLNHPSLDEDFFRVRITSAFAEHGISTQRLKFHSGWSLRGGGDCPDVDIVLDTFPYNGGTTTMDALWIIGAPVIVLDGLLPIQRLGASLMRQIALPDLIAKTPEDYLRIAVDLARDKDRLNDLRRSMRDRVAAAPFRDELGFTRDLETAYRRMWQRWCQCQTAITPSSLVPTAPEHETNARIEEKNSVSEQTATSAQQSTGHEPSQLFKESRRTEKPQKITKRKSVAHTKQKAQKTTIKNSQTDPLLAKSLEAWRTGQTEDALSLCQSALKIEPNRPDAWNLLGAVHRRRGETSKAMAAYNNAIKVQPSFADAWNNLANLHKDAGNFREAISCLRKAIHISPDTIAFYINCTDCLRLAGEYTEAEQLCSKAIDLSPNNADLYFSLGNIFYCQEKTMEAIKTFQVSLTLRQDFLGAHNNLGMALRKIGDFSGAEQHILQALRIDPKNIESYITLMHIYQDSGRWEEALRVGYKANELGANSVAFYVAFGNILQLMGSSSDSLIAYRAAANIDDTVPEVQMGIGVVNFRMGNYADATIFLKRAIELNSDSYAAWNNLGNVYKAQGNLEDAIRCYREALRLNPTLADVHSNLLLTLNYSTAYDKQALFQEHTQYDKQHIQPLKNRLTTHNNIKDADKKLRIGYVSGDLRRHAVAYYAEPILANHDRINFEIYCYYNYARKDDVTRRFQSYSDGWIDCIAMSDTQLAEKVRNDNIDILIDLSGHSAFNRLLMFGLKPAPIQMSFIGYPNTTGVSTIDYRISDSYLDPPGSEAYSAEAILRLTGSGTVYQAGIDCPLPREESPFIERGYVTYGSFNNFAKVTDEVLAAWAEILSRVTDSRMLIEAPGLDDSEFRHSVMDKLETGGVSSERLILMDRLPKNQYKLYNDVDICLDTFPFHGGTTNCDTLWMGVPLVTLTGDTMVSRLGLHALSNVGLEELSAATVDEYITTATNLGNDREWLQRTRAKLTREQLARAALFNPMLYTKDLEAAYRETWRKYCATQT